MSKENFISQILSLGLNHFAFDVIKTETKVTIVFSPKTKSTDPAVKALKPLQITFDSIEQMEENLFKLISNPVSKTVELFNGIEDYEKSLKEIEKNKKEAQAKPAEKKLTAADKKKIEAEAKKKEEEKVAPVLDFESEKTEDAHTVIQETIGGIFEEMRTGSAPMTEKLKDSIKEKESESSIEDAVITEEIPSEDIKPETEVIEPIQEEDHQEESIGSLFDDDDMPDFLK